MESMYGGKQGLSMVIKGRFDSLAAMEESFQKGASYTDIWYGEYCLIDTPNKNDHDNGKIYRRGLNYNETLGGAEYVGQIVGPSSGTPYFQFDTIKNVSDRTKDTLDKYMYRRYPADTNGDGEADKNADGSVVTAESNIPIGTFEFTSAANGGLVPGKDGSTYHDTVKYTWVNIRKDDADADSWFYVGFEFPYLVTDYQTKEISPYDSAGNLVAAAKSVTVDRVDDRAHPFYQKMELGIPKGIKGDTLRNLRVIVPTQKDVIYNPSALIVDVSTSKVSIDKSAVRDMSYEIKNSKQVIVYDVYIYDIKRNPEPYSIYLGDFNTISGVSVAADGTLTITYTHGETSVWSQRIRWVNTVSLVPDTGVFTVNFNNGSPYTTRLDWVKDLAISEDGTVTYTHTTRDVIEAKKVKWVTDAYMNLSNGTLTIKFNTGETYTSESFKYIKDISIAENGVITVTDASGATKNLTVKLSKVTNASVSDNGIITFGLNTSTGGVQDTFTVKEAGKQSDFKLKMVNDVSLATNIADDKYIKVKYNTETSSVNIGSPLNWIADMVRRETDFHLLVLYADPSKRGKTAGTDENGITWVERVAGSDGRITESGIYWRDFGALKDQGGVLVGLNLLKSDLGGQDILDYLNDPANTRFVGGLHEGSGGNDRSIAGKIVTYGDTASSSKSFYAYDYDKGAWYFLGTIADSGVRDAGLVDSSQVGTTAFRDSLSSGGVALVYQTSTNLKTGAMPKFWSASYIA